MPSIKKIKVIASPDVPKEDVKDIVHNGLHMMHKFEDEMHDHPFGHKLISIGKPMMMGGLHDIMDLVGGNTLPHLMHHLDHHPEFGGHGHHHEGEPHPHGCCKQRPPAPMLCEKGTGERRSNPSSVSCQPSSLLLAQCMQLCPLCMNATEKKCVAKRWNMLENRRLY